MPPKAGRKRTRESTGTTGNKAAATASSSAPGSAPPASRRTRSNSATSQQEEDSGGDNDPRATKRSRRGGASDRDTDSNEDVDMEESDGPAAANGGARRAGAPGDGVAAKKVSRRKSTSATVANGEVCMVLCNSILARTCGFSAFCSLKNNARLEMSVSSLETTLTKTKTWFTFPGFVW